jgi:peptide methionine sulfoxide reductase MsrB
VCGLPLFTAPRGRTVADFQADTAEHGWPSFRPEELIAANVITNETTGFVTSKCGTHLGSYLPDEKGARWCIDLSCIAGHAAA